MRFLLDLLLLLLQLQILQLTHSRLQNIFLSSGVVKPLKSQGQHWHCLLLNLIVGETVHHLLQMTSGEAEYHHRNLTSGLVAGKKLHLWLKETAGKMKVALKTVSGSSGDAQRSDERRSAFGSSVSRSSFLCS